MTLNLLDIVLLSCLGAVFLYQFYYYMRYINVTAWFHLREKHKAKHPLQGDGGLIPISVIISARNEAENLRNFLPRILEQDYPEFEVIVVNDSSQDDTQIVLEQLQNTYSNLRLTFVPNTARLLSTKKLAITLAVKAARYEHLVLTDADCYPASKNWLREMAKGFHIASREDAKTQKQIVLGYGAYEAPLLGDKGALFLNRLIRYDTLFNGLQYLGFAFTHHPYMGVGRNMAYTKSLFLKNHGFEGLLSHRSGDDDLLIQKMATRHNTSIRLTADSLTFSPTKTSFKDWLQQKRRHLSVATDYKSSKKLHLTLEPLSRGLFYALFIALMVLGSPLAMIIAGAAFLLRYIWQATILNLAAHRLQQGWFAFTILLFDIYLPINHLLLLCCNVLSPRSKRW